MCAVWFSLIFIINLNIFIFLINICHNQFKIQILADPAHIVIFNHIIYYIGKMLYICWGFSLGFCLPRWRVCVHFQITYSFSCVCVNVCGWGYVLNSYYFIYSADMFRIEYRLECVRV